METIIVYIDDAAYARQQLTPMCTSHGAAQATATHWVLVACAPRMTRRISKWVSHSAREHWRATWSEKLFGQLSPWLRQRGDRVTELLAHGPLVTLSTQLTAEHAGARVLDGRRPKFGHDMPPVTLDQQTEQQSPWTVPSTVAGIGMMLVMAAE
jgi:hypothetical protein